MTIAILSLIEIGALILALALCRAAARGDK